MLRHPCARFLLPILVLCASAAPSARADSEDEARERHRSRPDFLAPIGVMGDHLHDAGEWMVSYRYARMRMEGNRDRTSFERQLDIVGTGGNPGPFRVTPTDMEMEMHMFGLMYGVTDSVTVMAMLPFVRKTMDHSRRDGFEFETNSDGIGDFKLTGLIRVFEREHHSVHLNAGVSFPTGSETHDDRVPVPPPGGGSTTQRLPYPMQIGSGSYDLLPGITYGGHTDWLSWGAQAIGTFRTADNDKDYRLGHRGDFTAWLARPWTSWFSTSLRAQFSIWGNVQGDDRALDETLIPTADPERRGGRRLELLGGLNFNVPLGPLGRHRFGIEGGAPVYEWLRGPQLETDWRVVVGWRKGFGPLF